MFVIQTGITIQSDPFDYLSCIIFLLSRFLLPSSLLEYGNLTVDFVHSDTVRSFDFMNNKKLIWIFGSRS